MAWGVRITTEARDYALLAVLDGAGASTMVIVGAPDTLYVRDVGASAVAMWLERGGVVADVARCCAPPWVRLGAPRKPYKRKRRRAQAKAKAVPPRLRVVR